MDYKVVSESKLWGHDKIILRLAAAHVHLFLTHLVRPFLIKSAREAFLRRL